jgi:TetR/AcrR family transcriptional regulator, regulator of autoinduction and epiphytic fitness
VTAKPSRTYRSPLRDEQVRGTRRAVVAAAHDLFVEHGYAATTIDAVAERAGVSRKTVFSAVGGKAVLLKLALDWALAGDDEPVPLADRPEVRQERRETDPRALVRRWAHRLSVIESRVARLALVMAAAADADPEVDKVHQDSERGRRGGARAFVTRLGEIGGLREGVGIDQAAAVAGVISEPLVYQRLVVEAGWSVEAYATWMEDAVVAALLPR